MGKSHIIGVGLDLGGTYTGTFITSHPSDEAEHRDHSSAFTVVNSEKLSFSPQATVTEEPPKRMKLCLGNVNTEAEDQMQARANLRL